MSSTVHTAIRNIHCFLHASIGQLMLRKTALWWQGCSAPRCQYHHNQRSVHYNHLVQEIICSGKGGFGAHELLCTATSFDICRSWWNAWGNNGIAEVSHSSAYGMIRSTISVSFIESMKNVLNGNKNDLDLENKREISFAIRFRT